MHQCESACLYLYERCFPAHMLDILVSCLGLLAQVSTLMQRVSAREGKEVELLREQISLSRAQSLEGIDRLAIVPEVLPNDYHDPWCLL